MRSDPRSGSSPPAAYSTAVGEPANRQGALLRWRSDFLLFLITLAAIAGAAVVAVVAFEHAYIGIDDANISMVYAQHLADGHGFVYNIGDERVEGFTSFFHVLIEAAVFGLLPVPELFLIGFSVLCVTFAVFLLIKSLDALWSVDTDSKARFSPLQLVVIAWVVCAPFFVFWSTVSLMETALWCLLLSSGVALVLFEVMGGGRARARLAGITALAVLIPLTRPEGFVLAPVIIVAFAAARRFCSSSWSA